MNASTAFESIRMTAWYGGLKGLQMKSRNSYKDIGSHDSIYIS